MVARLALPGLCLALVVATAGCGGGDGADQASASSTPSGTRDNASLTALAELPEGTYRTDTLRAQDLVDAATAAGYSAAKAKQLAGYYTGTVVFELVIKAGTIDQKEVVDGGAPQEGSRAAYVITDADTIVATDQCGETTFDFTLDGTLLTLDLVDIVAGGCDIPADDVILATMIFESGPFARQAAPAHGGGTQGVDNASQAIDTFVVPFRIRLADWLDPGSAENTKQFATWQSRDEQRALRVLSPVSVYQPGSSTESPPPADFAAYVLSLVDSGATISDRVGTEVDGHPAVEVTVGLAAGTNSLDGAFGCPEPGLDAGDCFGPQDELVLRMVVLDVAGTPLLIWERDYADRADSVDYASFDEMVASVHFT